MKSVSNNKGFTLTELLVTIAIIAVLLGLAVAFGTKIMSAGNEQATKANMAIIINAMETFRDETGNYPTSSNNWARTDALLNTLKADPKTLEKLQGLPADAVKEFVEGGVTFKAFADGYGYYLQYHERGGLGGTPALRSAGRDKNFDTTDDNIRSDR